MKAQVVLNVNAQKHLIAKALTKIVDLKKRVYVAYGSLNQYFLYHLGIEFDTPYIAGCVVENKLNVTKARLKPIVLEDKKIIDIKNFEITKEDYFIKGANALWYENGKKQAGVLVADKRGGTYSNFYLKAAAMGANVIIAVNHEKLIPCFVETSQNVDYSMGSKVALFRFFYGRVFSEIESFEVLFDCKAKVIASGGILGNEGSVVFEIEGDVKKAVEFIEKYQNIEVIKKGEFEY